MYNKLMIVMILACTSIIVATQILTKEKTIEINAKSNLIELTCNTTFEDLLANVYSYEDVEILIDNANWFDIVDKRKVTFVAIDKNKNVSKLSINVNPHVEMLEYQIVAIKETIIEQNNDFKVSEYFALQNGCGWTKDSVLSIENININTLGEQSVIIFANNSDIEPLETILMVKEFQTPIIKLKIDSIKLSIDDEFDTMDYLEMISDNLDDLTFEDVKIESNVDTKKPGIYLVNYSVIDSDGNIGKVQLKVEVEQEILQTTPTPTSTIYPNSNNTATPKPTWKPDKTPTPEVTPEPTEESNVTPEPTPKPTEKPIATPGTTPKPTEWPTVEPTESPTPEPTPEPTETSNPDATVEPTQEPTDEE